MAKQAKDSLRSHRYLGNVISGIGTTQESEWLWNWIEGRESFYGPTLYDHGTAANVYCNILSGIGWAASLILRLKGLAVIMDEAESVDPGWYYGYQVEKGFNLICGLMLVAGNDIRLGCEPINIKDQPGIGTWFGKETDLIYHGLTKVRYCFKFPSFLKVAFAFTPTYIVDRLRRLPTRILCLRLEPLSGKSLRKVFKHICLLYDSSYGFPQSDSDIQSCFEVIKAKSRTGTRSFIKGSVEILDLRRFHPDLPLEHIE